MEKLFLLLFNSSDKWKVLTLAPKVVPAILLMLPVSFYKLSKAIKI